MRIAALLVLTSLLAGCAVYVPPPIDAAGRRARTEALLSYTEWSLRGRIAVSDGEDGGSARIRWNTDESGYELWIFAPLGQGTWRLSGDGTRATLTGPEGTFTGPDAGTLLARHMGWHLPVEALTYWVRGMPAPHRPADVQYGRRGHLQVIEQAGWHVEISEWTDRPVFDLPYRIEAHRAPYTVKMVILDWTLGPGDSRRG